MTERKKLFTIRPYDVPVVIVVTDDLRGSYLKLKLDPERFPAAALAFMAVTTKKLFVFLPTGSTPGTVAHEMLHVVDFTLNRAGVEYDDEVWAYHLGELVDEAALLLYEVPKGKKIADARTTDQ